MHSKKFTIIYLISNLIGILLYSVFLLHIAYSIKSEHRSPDFGDSLNVIMTAIPVMLLCGLFSLVWAIISLINIYRHRDYQGVIALTVEIATWLGVISAFKFI
jgi:hypothetical protein